MATSHGHEGEHGGGWRDVEERVDGNKRGTKEKKAAGFGCNRVGRPPASYPLPHPCSVRTLAAFDDSLDGLTSTIAVTSCEMNPVSRHTLISSFGMDIELAPTTFALTFD